MLNMKNFFDALAEVLDELQEDDYSVSEQQRNLLKDELSKRLLSQNQRDARLEELAVVNFENGEYLKELVLFYLQENESEYSLKQERAADFFIREGLLYKDSVLAGNLGNEKAAHSELANLYVILENNQLVIGRNVHHSGLALGYPVRCAGCIEITDSKISYLDNSSGHYLPTAIELYNVVKSLDEQNAFAENATVRVVGDPGIAEVALPYKLFLSLMEMKNDKGISYIDYKRQALVQKVAADPILTAQQQAEHRITDYDQTWFVFNSLHLNGDVGRAYEKLMLENLEKIFSTWLDSKKYTLMYQLALDIETINPDIFKVLMEFIITHEVKKTLTRPSEFDKPITALIQKYQDQEPWAHPYFHIILSQDCREKFREYARKIENGVIPDVNVVDSKGRTLLHIAVANYWVDRHLAFKALIKSNPEITAVDHNGNLPLHYLDRVSFLTPELFAELFDVLCTPELVNKANKLGFTPLHAAVQSANLMLIKSLLTAGANPLQKNLKGENAFNLVLAKKYYYGKDLEITKLLLNHCETIDHQTFEAIKSAAGKQSPFYKEFQTLYEKAKLKISTGEEVGTTLPLYHTSISPPPQTPPQNEQHVPQFMAAAPKISDLQLGFRS